MSYAPAIVNPFYAARLIRSPVSQAEAKRNPIYARLPLAPITGSPVLPAARID